MNKVSERCKRDSCAKFHFASQRIFEELKYTRMFMYLLNIVPVVICFLPSTDTLIKLICSCISFGLTILNEVVTAIMSNAKEKAILQHQLYEAEITGSSFSKIEYDRELTNDINELAIRKGLPKMKKVAAYPTSDVPQEITDDYSYLYLCRSSAAKTRYLVSRLFYFYAIFLVVVALVFIAVNFAQSTTGQTLYLLVCLWPLIIPIIRNLTSCKKCSRQCVKICADIDNFFADGDNSVQRLARFYYYVQNIEFEMLLTRPVIFKVIQKMYKRGTNVLQDGVTQRFKDAIIELKGRNLMMKGVIEQPHGKSLITKTDIDLNYLKKAAKESKAKLSKQEPATKKPQAPTKPADKKEFTKTKEKPTTQAPKVATKPETKASAKQVAASKPQAKPQPKDKKVVEAKTTKSTSTKPATKTTTKKK